MANINKPVIGAEDYIIESCTNTGVWVVHQQDAQTGQVLVVYDFVNREFTPILTNSDPISIDAVSEPEKEAFFTLQKSLNQALLKNNE